MRLQQEPPRDGSADPRERVRRSKITGVRARPDIGL
jgi:hypothetical protein